MGRGLGVALVGGLCVGVVIYLNVGFAQAGWSAWCSRQGLFFLSGASRWCDPRQVGNLLVEEGRVSLVS